MATQRHIHCAGFMDKLSAHHLEISLRTINLKYFDRIARNIHYLARTYSDSLIYLKTFILLISCQ